MGIEVAIGLLAVSGVSKIAKSSMEVEAAQQREQALTLQSEQTQLQTQQKQLSNLDVMEKVLDAQTAALTTRGVAFSSPSFNAIQRATYNVGARNEKNIEIESDIAQRNIDIEKANVRSTLYAQLFSDASDFAASAASSIAKFPMILDE